MEQFYSFQSLRITCQACCGFKKIKSLDKTKAILSILKKSYSCQQTKAAGSQIYNK